MQVPTDRAIELLRTGEITLLGLLPGASNYTFAAELADGDLRTVAVYKPRAGETPLWDFPDGTLYRREVAAYEISRAAGWDLVPPTIVRDGPHGVGSLQVFVDADFSEHYFTLMPRHSDRFRHVAAFDVVVNNADRKSSHCLLDEASGRLWFVDHGVCFHEVPKLRTVIWEFAGEPLPEDVVDRVEQALRALEEGDLRARLAALLSDAETAALERRARLLLAEGRFPDPPDDRRAYPWPPV